MSMDKIRNLNEIKEASFALYPNAVKLQITFEGDKVTVVPTEKYEIDPVALGD
ncbi:hypothetical protein [Paenibacillus pini]|uniref:Uncharacterized protein n=1 Tax=Paenibacillus pini JCM 16418 TaxID=1236976 RepID=W7Z8Y5_9BACL|nr:hypothetical protein [Paenibacillus pini]GAF10924.1 hypothetical protein JCM16418_5163 [Paenibacillus pini JCM 16418]